MKLSPRKLIGRNYDEVLQELSSLGIENVVIEREMEVSKKAKPETIVKVNINDQEDCPDDYYQRDSDIELIFYRPKTDEEISLEHPNEIKMTKSSKEYLGKDYKEVQKELAELGYGNIQVKEMAKSKIDIFSKPNQVAKILIGESTNFDEGSWHDPQVTITIYYYVLV